MNLKRFFSIWALAIILAGLSLSARADDVPEAVTVRQAKIYSLQGETVAALTENLKLAADLEINTNGNFQVAAGKPRALREGQILRRDGWLVNADGSVEPAADHLAMQAGKVVMVRNGETEPVTEPLSLPNNFKVNPDGTCLYPDGKRTRLRDGQLFGLDGAPIPSKDTVTLKNGQIVVQKDGVLIPLAAGKIMGMNDGSRIYGNGSIQKRDGTTIQLREGKTILIDGAAVNR
jgi:hypothetical protein